MTETYRIETLSDMLKVPADRRAAMFRDLETALELHEFTFGEEAATTPLTEITWTDDGDPSVALSDTDGNHILTLEVTEQESQAAGTREGKQ